MSALTDRRLPTYFISHGGGPWPWIKGMMPGDFGPLERSLQAIPRDLGVTPTAILMVSGHWETDEFTVQTGANPPMLYDYGGFPEFTYHIQYPAPGAPAVAERVGELLTAAGIPVGTDAHRGFDHGVFAPMAVAYPAADVPILQLSIKRSFDPGDHLAAGRALAPLRDEGVLIVGSGFSYHNLRLFGPAARVPSQQFGRWLTDTVVDSDPERRTRRLLEWESAPSARVAHPAEDHLIPLMVAAGAAEQEAALVAYHQDDFMEHVASTSYRFGLTPREQLAAV